jgi:pyridoxal phosphate enzyme (YggS family)
MTRSQAIADGLARVRARIAAAEQAAGRARGSARLVAVSKKMTADDVRAALAAGQRAFGENYAQELAAKRGEVADLALRWHFIGRLQRNKAKLVAGQVALVHAVDTAELATELARRAAGSVQPVLLSVNVAGEDSKGGVIAETAAVAAAARAIAAVTGIRLDGLMTMPPPADDPEASRGPFTALRALRDRLQQELGLALPVLSMGMSGDFEVAIACGATHVRIGTAIFGSRA